MHELQVTERILEVALSHASGHEVSRIVTINLTVGELSDLEDEWIQHYFDYLSRGTVAENARLVIKRAPVVLCCDSCSCSFAIKRSELGEVGCPQCGESRCQVVAGREYVVENMEVV